MTKKTIKTDNLQEMNLKTIIALNQIISVWEIGMKTFPINSREYRKICAAGRNLQKLRMMLASEYEEVTDDGRYIPEVSVDFI